MNVDGYGYEWDASLIGGPADGCIDRVIQTDGDIHPPEQFIKILDGGIEREPIGKKLLQSWGEKHLPDSTKVALYRIRGNREDVDEDQDLCVYDYVESTTMGKIRKGK